jgi:hypothetical protein
MALWNHDKLKARGARTAADRIAAKPAERAALAWARWQGMTDEAGIDREAAKRELDRLVDAMEPEQWWDLYRKLSGAGDAAVRGVLKYSVERAATQVPDMVADILGHDASPPGDEPVAGQAMDDDQRPDDDRPRRRGRKM